MYPLSGTVQHYAWGTTDVIPKMLGVAETGEPFAEYWLGAHSSSPSLVFGQPFDRLISESPEIIGDSSVCQFGPKLPYLVKILSAAHALSLQAHPSRTQAEAGFAKENNAGVPLDSPVRTYRDDWPKPEMLIALEPFDALCGFRDPISTFHLFHELKLPPDIDVVIGPLLLRSGSAGLAEVFLDCLTPGEHRKDIMTQVMAAAVKHASDEGPVGEFARTALLLDEQHPADPAIIAALLMNRLHLNPGEAIFLRPGLMHAYLQGTGVEIMANSDNVVRGGLTNKHIAVDELIQVVDFSSAPVDISTPTKVSPGLFKFPSITEEFAVWGVEVNPDVTVETPCPDAGRIMLATDGRLTIASHTSSLELGAGDACFITAHENTKITGDGRAIITAPGV